MRLEFIALDKLVISTSNMRYARKAPDVADILPSVRQRGVLQPCLVRPNCAPDGYEVVAGARRFTAAKIVADERRAGGDEAEPLPCAVLDDGDDADAVEASLIENIARRDADEVTQWATFTRLVKEGRSVDDIGATFGLADLSVRRILALGNLLPAIRRMYAAEQIDRVTVRHLTLASKRQQQAWLALAADDNAYVPTGHQLKAWLFGGQSIAVKHALFDVAASGLATVADLFGEDAYFADSDAFWTAQNAEIDARRAAFIDAGWADAVVVPPSEYFSSWEYDKAGKRKGGRVYFDVRASGEVTVHEGYVSRREAVRAARGGATAADKPKRPEITAAGQTYVDLHRHAAVRAALTGHPGVALRLMVAHLVAGSPLWSVRREPQAARDEGTRESVETCVGETRFDERRRAALGVLGMNPEAPTVTGGNGDDYVLVRLFMRLLDLPDASVMDVVAVAMGETLQAGSSAVEVAGATLGIDMADYWRADTAFLDLVRDKEVLVAMVAEVAGETVASANAKEKGKTLKRIVTDHLDGEGGRDKVEHWVPRWMAFPPSAYTPRGGVGTVKASARVAAATADPDAGIDRDPDPAGPAAFAGGAGADDVGGDDAGGEAFDQDERLAA
ncbi:ParB/RepB/Spo0J family partition protein [Sphingomonas sp.]|jgi:ParB family chromosome partitioning protein|uniref:ParB/RepB/Spo0J family partition protein n=1 Tax=Sphingomonas sp. TaxID=28214 RepID=UPI002E374043|nr:ParB/RepB/Spo0J family partition protein [Sphingomonas sp.]HEX4693603.1 ParB/RepB/Spo0J family partition protein [Sphingomonas sp.]